MAKQPPGGRGFGGFVSKAVSSIGSILRGGNVSSGGGGRTSIHQPPPPTVVPDLPFHAQPTPNPRDSIAKPDEREALLQLKQQLPALLERGGGTRAQRFYPYLLLRSRTGDHGDRPGTFNTNEKTHGSPDIWVAPGTPSLTPDIPADAGPNSLPSLSAWTVYAHVWNLGRAPAVGVLVEFYWFSNSYQFSDMAADDAHAQLLGMARVDLAPRSSPRCHHLVKCPKPFGTGLNIGFNAIRDLVFVARVTGVGDRYDHNRRWDALNDRHVAMRSFTILPAGKIGDPTR